MLVASQLLAKEMILTHGECERSSIVLGGLLVGVVCTEEEKKTNSNFEKSGGYFSGSAPPLSELPIRKGARVQYSSRD